MTDSLPSLIQAVENADSSARLLEAVVKLAAARREDAIPTLIATLSYNNPGAAVAAVDGLIQLGGSAIPALMEQLDLHNYTARAWAIRAIASISDPRGLVVLLRAATNDFAFSVRRAAAKGLGTMNWHWFPNDLIDIAQEQVLAALLRVAQQDVEWVVRYSAVLGLQTLASAITDSHPEWRTQILSQFEQMAGNDISLTVRARIWMAQQHLDTEALEPTTKKADDQPSPLSETDWQGILEQLNAYKAQKRPTSAEGTLHRRQDPVTAIAQTASSA